MQLTVLRNIALSVLAATSLWGQQQRITPPTTQVMAFLTVNNEVDRARIMKAMPSEIRATVRLYLEGQIQQWFSRGDGKGVVFVLNAKSVDEARAITDTLPLIKEKLASFEYLPVGPLMPLRFLLEPPPQ